MGLERYLQTWEILLICCNNQFKKFIAPLLRLVRGHSSPSSDVYIRNFLLLLFTVINLLPNKIPEWPSLVSHSKAKSSLEITNPTSFTVSYQNIMKWQLKNATKKEKWDEEIQRYYGGGWGYPGVMWCALDKGNLESLFSRGNNWVEIEVKWEIVSCKYVEEKWTRDSFSKLKHIRIV